MKRSYPYESKTHYKMYKKGKTWVTMGVTLLSVGLGLELSSSVNADNVSSSLSSSSSSVANKKASTQSNVVSLKSSLVKSTTPVSSSTKSTSSVKTSTGNASSKVSTLDYLNTSSVRAGMKSGVKNTDFAVVSSTQGSSSQYVQRYDTSHSANGDGVFEGTKGKTMYWPQAVQKYDGQYQMNVYMLNANGGQKGGHDYMVTDNPDVVLWNRNTGDAYFGAFGTQHSNADTVGVEYNAGKSGLVTVHAPEGWKFDIPYTKWYDPMRSGLYFVKTTPDTIEFSFEKAIDATHHSNNTLETGNKADCLFLFLVKNGEQSPVIPTVPKDSYQNVMNMTVRDSGKSDDGAPVAQYVMNFYYGKKNPKEIHANNPAATTFVVYAPKGYKFDLSDKGDFNYINPQKGIYSQLDLTGSPDPSHIAFYTTYDCPYGGSGGHYSTYRNPDSQSHFYTNKVWVVPDETWQGAPSYAKDGWMIKSNWEVVRSGKPATNNKPTASVTPSKPATNNKPAASVTPSKPATNNKSVASVTPSKPATNNKPTASVTPSKPATNNKSVASVTPSKPATNNKPTASVTPSKPATNNKPVASVTPSKPATNNKPTASVTPSKPATNNKPVASVTPSKHAAAEGLPSSKRVAKKTTSKTNRVIGTVNADQIKKSKSSEMRSAVNKSASLPVTGESSNSLKEIGLVMSSAVLGLLGLLGFTSEKKH